MRSLKQYAKIGLASLVLGLSMHCGGSSGGGSSGGGTTTYQCNDKKDNDGDGKIDYPADSGCSSAKDNSEYNAPPVITAKDYVEKWFPQNEVCLNYNEITTMVNGEGVIPSYIDSLVTEIENCTFSQNVPCPYLVAKLDLLEFSNGILNDYEFHSGDPKPFYLEKTYNDICQNDGTVEYNLEQGTIIFCVQQLNATNLNDLIKGFLIQYVDNHKVDYNNLNLTYNPGWGNCSL